MELKVRGPARLKGELLVPGDKSISHRSVIIGALAHGKTEIRGFLWSEDCINTIRCMRALGVRIETRDRQGPVTVYGEGLDSLREPEKVLWVGNSGTLIRLILGVLAGHEFTTIVNGDRSIRRRPMGRVVYPLCEMGATILGRQGGTLAPLCVSGGKLRAINYSSPIASAQLKSSILLAGLHAEGTTSVEEPTKSRDHTERMLARFGAKVMTDGLRIQVEGPARLSSQKIEIPGDVSSSAFFIVGAVITEGSEVILRNVGMNPTRSAVVSVLSNMGADITVTNVRDEGNEPVADIHARGTSQLRGITIGGDLVPNLIDEIPVLAVAAACALGPTVIKDAAELRVKETDRIRAIASELRKFGVDVEERPDGMIIHGEGRFEAAHCKMVHCETYGDHRIAMAMAIAGLAASAETVIHNTRCILTSYPGFVETLNSLTVLS